MNFTTPGTGRPAADALEHVARLVAGAGAAVVVDPVAGRLLAASPAAIERLGLRVAESQALDRAMPAWTAIEAALARPVAAPAMRQPIVWWSAAGPRALDATLMAIVVGDRRVVRLEFPGEAGKPGPAEAAQPATPPPPRDDTSTLQEIARRIRSGLGAAVAGSEVSAATPAVAVPPPLDFRQEFAVDAEEPGPTLTPEPTGVRRLAHELRTPLSAIVSLSEIMRDQRLGAMGNDRYLSYAADIHDTAQHTLDLVRTLLDGGRADVADRSAAAPDASGAAIALEPVDLGDLAQRCQSAMAPVAARANVRLMVSAEPGLPSVQADRRAIRQIILNLLSNALRFTPSGGEILIEVVRAADGGQDLAVTDTGRGMSEAELAHARGDAAAPRKARIAVAGSDGGSCFGLPIVRELVAAHAARLIVESAPGAGTTVTVQFPAVRSSP